MFCFDFSPSTENCSFTLQRGPELTLRASRRSVVPSAWVKVMFSLGKSSSITSNTWTPTLTCPVLVSVHPALKTSTRNLLKEEFEVMFEAVKRLNVSRETVLNVAESQ